MRSLVISNLGIVVARGMHSSDSHTLVAFFCEGPTSLICIFHLSTFTEEFNPSSWAMICDALFASSLAYGGNFPIQRSMKWDLVSMDFLCSMS